MNKVLIVAEHDGERLNQNTAKCVTCALAIPEAEVTITTAPRALDVFPDRSQA